MLDKQHTKNALSLRDNWILSGAMLVLLCLWYNAVLITQTSVPEFPPWKAFAIVEPWCQVSWVNRDCAVRKLRWWTGRVDVLFYMLTASPHGRPGLAILRLVTYYLLYYINVDCCAAEGGLQLGLTRASTIHSRGTKWRRDCVGNFKTDSTTS